MCIEHLFRPEQIKKWRVGYKVLNRYAAGLHSQIYSGFGPIPVGQWVDEKDFRYASTYPTRYEAGWHSFIYLKDARSWQHDCGGVIRKVSIRNIRAAGISDGAFNTKGLVAVSQFIYIHPKPIANAQRSQK